MNTFIRWLIRNTTEQHAKIPISNLGRRTFFPQSACPMAAICSANFFINTENFQFSFFHKCFFHTNLHQSWHSILSCTFVCSANFASKSFCRKTMSKKKNNLSEPNTEKKVNLINGKAFCRNTRETFLFTFYRGNHNVFEYFRKCYKIFSLRKSFFQLLLPFLP